MKQFIKRYERIITTDKKFLIKRCEERGYTLEEVMPCVQSKDGDIWTIDTHHEAYPMTMKPHIVERNRILATYAAPQSPDGGVGTELKKLLKMIGITASPTCSCNTRAALMDAKGIEWCKNNTETIIDWLQEEAKKRKLPFLRIAGKKMLQMAIKRAEAKVQK